MIKGFVLVYILIVSETETIGHEVGRYSSMVDCFFAREEMLMKQESYDGIPEVNTQFVCVATDK